MLFYKVLTFLNDQTSSSNFIDHVSKGGCLVCKYTVSTILTDQSAASIVTYWVRRDSRHMLVGYLLLTFLNDQTLSSIFADYVGRNQLPLA